MRHCRKRSILVVLKNIQPKGLPTAIVSDTTLAMQGTELLKNWLDAEQIKKAEAARRFDYDKSNFHNLLKGKIRPTLDLAKRIEVETNGAVPMQSWARVQ